MSEEKRTWIGRLWSRIMEGPPEPPPRPRLTIESDGFAYVVPDDKTLVKWADVKEIVAYKVDLFAYDLICIGFRVSEEECYEIDEKMIGYDALLESLPNAFPGVRTDWFWDVAVPAFEANPTVLWQRDDPASHDSVTWH